MTGAPIPAGADAVIPVEKTAGLDLAASIEVRERCLARQNVGSRGEDIRRGTTLLRAGRVLRPQDVGVLASIGVSPVRVLRRPEIAILAKSGPSRLVLSTTVLIQALLRE